MDSDDNGIEHFRCVDGRIAGHPTLALMVEDVARERSVRSRAIAHPGWGRHHPTINLLKQWWLEPTPLCR